MHPQHYFVHRKEVHKSRTKKAGNVFKVQNNRRVRKTDLLNPLATLNRVGINQSHLAVTRIQRLLICPYPHCCYKTYFWVKIHQNCIDLRYSYYQINKDGMKHHFFRRRKRKEDFIIRNSLLVLAVSLAKFLQKALFQRTSFLSLYQFFLVLLHTFFMCFYMDSLNFAQLSFVYVVSRQNL